MNLAIQVTNNQLELQDEMLTLQLSLHEGLQLLNEIDKALVYASNQEKLEATINVGTLNTLETIEAFYSDLIKSLMLLGTRDRQLFINEASPTALACLVYLFKGKPIEQLLRDNLSQRRLSQIEEELGYFKISLKPEVQGFTDHSLMTMTKVLDEILAPFYISLCKRLEENEITLQDPQGIYFKVAN